jgi:hypothetical protein
VESATLVHDEVLADPTPDLGDPNETLVWVGDVLKLVSVIRNTTRLGRYPEHVAGDACDEALMLSGLLLGLGIDPTIPGSLQKFLARLKLESEQSQRQEMADLTGALNVAVARLGALNKAGHGDIIIPQTLRLHADMFVMGGTEALVKFEELPPNHRLRDLLPVPELCLGKYVCLGPWLVNVFGVRTPPGGISLESIKRRTRQLKTGSD